MEKTWGSIVMTDNQEKFLLAITCLNLGLVEGESGRVDEAGHCSTVFTVHLSMHLKLGAVPLSFQSLAFLLGGVDLIIVPLSVRLDTDSLGHLWGMFVQDVLESSTVSGDCSIHIISLRQVLLETFKVTAKLFSVQSAICSGCSLPHDRWGL